MIPYLGRPINPLALASAWSGVAVAICLEEKKKALPYSIRTYFLIHPEPCLKGLAIFVPVPPVRELAPGPFSEPLHASPSKILNVCRHVIIRIFLPVRNGALS
jgi:hypothetical protein